MFLIVQCVSFSVEVGIGRVHKGFDHVSSMLGKEFGQESNVGLRFRKIGQG